MFNIINSQDFMDHDVFKFMDALLRYPFEDQQIANSGLKQIIHRPHNLIEVHDAKGNIIAQRVEVVTTPFTKDDVKVTVLNNILTVECGNEKSEAKADANDKIIYHGISSQSYAFMLTLPQNVDQKAITAKNEDGILKITLPLIAVKEPEPTQIAVE
jgi:HSP20 family molecular chaperone IbpA